ncbi:TPA: hypothetical protein EYP84_05115 [Candidatus Bipolaricaulota bacterium]|nr:hypothetical protein [Candidatus Bipolaricaulota bacterium]HIP99698.1 hypothetical protein [Candidatus Bipolaricaulota bacterium]
MDRGIRLITLGFVLLVLGWILPILMVLRLMAPNMGLSFLSFSSSVAGLLLGLAGIAQHTRSGRGPTP